MNHKRRHRRGFVGCCGMCACRKYDGGLPNKRRPSIAEMRSATLTDVADRRQLGRLDHAAMRFSETS